MKATHVSHRPAADSSRFQIIPQLCYLNHHLLKSNEHRRHFFVSRPPVRNGTGSCRTVADRHKKKLPANLSDGLRGGVKGNERRPKNRLRHRPERLFVRFGHHHHGANIPVLQYLRSEIGHIG